MYVVILRSRGDIFRIDCGAVLLESTMVAFSKEILSADMSERRLCCGVVICICGQLVAVVSDNFDPASSLFRFMPERKSILGHLEPLRLYRRLLSEA